MTDALLGLPTVAILALALGAGWSAVLRRAAPWGFLGFVFRAWVCAIAITSVAWAWAYPLDLNVKWGIGLQLAVSLTGYVIAVRLRSFSYVRQEASPWVLAQLVAPFVLTVIALVPAMASMTHLSVGERIGPDALGNAISARAIDEGLTHKRIVDEILRESGGDSIGQVISPVTKLNDTTPSFTTQVQGEFLEAADRWGFAGAVGSILFIVGDGHIWSLLSLLAGFALLATCTGMWALIRWRGHGVSSALFASIIVALSPSLLNAWHEGGLGQIWMMPAVLILVSPIARLGDGDRVGKAVAAGLGVAAILPSYNTDILTFGVLLAVAAAISVPILRRKWWFEWSGVVLGITLATIVVLPSSVAFLATMSRSLTYYSAGGWTQSHWASLGEAFGLSNSYGVPHVGLVARSFANRLLDGMSGLVVLVFLASLCRRRTTRPPFVLLASTLLLGAAIYVDTRYVTRVSNYQYFKAIATLAPAGGLALGLLLGEPRSAKSRDSSTVSTRSRLRISDRIVAATGAIIVVAILFSAGSYIDDYRKAGSTIPISFTNLSSSHEAQAIFDRYNIVAEVLGPPQNPDLAKLNTYALAAEVNLRFIGRSFGQPSIRLGERVFNPVGMLVFQYQCPGYACLSKIDKRLIVFEGSGIAVVQLSPDTQALSNMPEQQWWQWIAKRYRQLGGSLPGLLPSGPPS